MSFCIRTDSCTQTNMFTNSNGGRELRSKYDQLSDDSELPLGPGSMGSPTAVLAEDSLRFDHFYTNNVLIHNETDLKLTSDKSTDDNESFKEISSPRHVWERSWCTARVKRAALSAVALMALTACGCLAWVLTARAPPPETEPEYAPSTGPELPLEWNISRSMWGADPQRVRPFPWEPAVRPLRLVVVQHTAGHTCFRRDTCAAAVRALQRYYLTYVGWDLPYNYMVGNDGRVYEGRGWEGGEAAHTLHYNRCSLGIGFMGNYMRVDGDARVTDLQLNRTLQFLAGSVRAGLLHPRYVVVAASDLSTTQSPGAELYDALRRWPHFNVDPDRFRGRTCPDIYGELRSLDEDRSRAGPF